MPDNVPTEPAQEGREPLPPVAWLLGRQLIASLKWILLYTAFGTKLDARDWMDARVYPADDQAEADEQWKKMHSRIEGGDPSASDAGKSGTDFWAGKEFWFDYLSDTGDGTTATYSIAYLCLNNLWMKKRWEEMPDPKEAGLRLECFKKEDDEYPEPLPRGEFLLIGGDTSYHLSDYATLHLRFQSPFNWAYQDLTEDLKKVGKQIDDEASRAIGTNRRPLFGIPGNHDYYDMLDGFRRQFRTPVVTRPETKVYSKNDLTAPQLMIHGFKREQNTSYVALRLPFGWMLWGLDTEVGKIDERQRDFFRHTNQEKIPDKLIVATSAPTTVFGKLADRDDEKCSKAFFQLKLPRPFVSEKEIGEPVDLAPNQIRLDIAGDVHQYARYWGPANRITNPRTTATAAAPSAQNYASVVSGLGGAFHHPSTTYVDEIKEQALYPTEETSRKAVAAEIFNPVKVFRGGGVGVIGAAIALVLAFAAIANDSSRPAIHNFALFNYLHITQPEHYESTVVSNAEQKAKKLSQAQETVAAATAENIATDAQPKIVEPFVLWRRGLFAITDATWSPVVDQSKLPAGSDLSRCQQYRLLYLWGDCQVKWPVDYKIGMFMLLATLFVIGFTFYLSERAYKLADKQEDVQQGARSPQQGDEVPTKKKAEKVANKVLWSLWPTLALNVVLGVIGVLSIIPYRPFITPFGNSLWVLLTLAWAASSIIFSMRYSDWLFIQASKTAVTSKDWLITWALAAATLASLAVGLWLFGKNNLPAYLVADIIFVTVLIATFVGLIYVAVSMGGEHQRGLGKWGMGVLGFWHWLLQVGVALFLLKKGTWLTVALAGLACFIFNAFGKRFMKENYKWRLVGAWVAFGATMLALPPLVFWWFAKISTLDPTLWNFLFWPHKGPTSFASYEWWGDYGGFWQLIPLTVACLLGLGLSCIWIGWYFAVCLRFNGHNNESGGAARIENYKQFIRFRLRENDLTGYVIAVDNPNTAGSRLQGDARIVDIFQLKRVT
ncbi:MAG: hypothetical protein ABI967_00075 [bacterium]